MENNTLYKTYSRLLEEYNKLNIEYRRYSYKLSEKARTERQEKLKQLDSEIRKTLNDLIQSQSIFKPEHRRYRTANENLL